MDIKAETLQNLIHGPYASDREQGGLLGGKVGLISTVYVDKGLDIGKRCSYAPDTDTCNRVISDWLEKGLDFYGIFHTHMDGTELSDSDVLYIARIMRALADYTDSLYFPVVIPKREVKVYKTLYQDGKMKIMNDKIIII